MKSFTNYLFENIDLASLVGADTSPLNVDLNPTQKDAEDGNYEKALIPMEGFNVMIENPIGSIRKVGDNQYPFSANYGYIENTIGADGDGIDVFIKSGTVNDNKNNVIVINQINPENGNFDEHKCILGADSLDDGIQIYKNHYDKDWNGMDSAHEVPFDSFKSWVLDGKKKTKPYKPK